MASDLSINLLLRVNAKNRYCRTNCDDDGPGRVHSSSSAKTLAVHTALGELGDGCQMRAPDSPHVTIVPCCCAGEVLVSSTVKDLVAGSGLRFGDRGSQSLKGVPGEWHIYAVER